MLLNEQNNLLQLRNFNIHRAKYLSFELCLFIQVIFLK
jgi:hypothetical protein